MKELKIIDTSTQVYGIIIEMSGNCFKLNKYGKNEYGNYECIETLKTIKPLSTEDMDIMSRADSDAKIRRLHHYMRAADYISQEVIDNLQ